MRRRLRLLAGHAESTLDAVRASYWFLPMLMALGAAVAALVLVEVGDAANAFLDEHLPWATVESPSGTRDVLSTIASSMITVTGVVFSITVVALTLASSQFGPRLLRSFLRDRANQASFGAFVGTYLYSLIVLRGVTDDRVPHLATLVAVVLAAASVFVLIYFIHNTAASIQASSVLAAVAGELEAQLGSLFPERLGTGDPPDDDEITRTRDRIETDGWNVLATSDGFIRVVNAEGLMRLTRERDLVVDLRHRPGDFVCAGARLARVTPGGSRVDEVEEDLRACFVLGDHRTGVQDIGFLIGQLTEIAARALSPGVNDPRTASDCARRLGAVVCRVVDRDMPGPVRRDDPGHIRVIAPVTTFEEIVGRVFDPLRWYGADHVDVVIACLDAISLAAEQAEDADRRAVLGTHAGLIRDAFHDGEPVTRDREAVDAAYRRVTMLLDSGSGDGPDPVRGASI